MTPEQARELSHKACDCLNAAFAADPAAIHALIATGMPCNQALADDPFIVVDHMPVLKGGPYFSVRLGGILAGITDAMGLPKIATKWSDEVDEDGRKKFVGFCVYEPDCTERA